jgi:hypothetical protein
VAIIPIVVFGSTLPRREALAHGTSLVGRKLRFELPELARLAEVVVEPLEQPAVRAVVLAGGAALVALWRLPAGYLMMEIAKRWSPSAPAESCYDRGRGWREDTVELMLA